MGKDSEQEESSPKSLELRSKSSEIGPSRRASLREANKLVANRRLVVVGEFRPYVQL